MSFSKTRVEGPSIGTGIEAAWFGYDARYAYTGTSSPETGFLPYENLSPFSMRAKALAKFPLVIRTTNDGVQFAFKGSKQSGNPLVSRTGQPAIVAWTTEYLPGAQEEVRNDELIVAESPAPFLGWRM